ncbi:glycosyltransferase, partial [Streptomyces sp. NPDC001858]
MDLGRQAGEHQADVRRSEALRSFQAAWAKSPVEVPSEGELGNPVHVALVRAYALVGRFQRLPFGGMAARLEEHAGNFHMLSPADQDVVVVADFLRRQPTAHPDEAVRLARELSRGKPTPDAKALAGSPAFTGFQDFPDLVSPARSGSQTVPAAAARRGASTDFAALADELLGAMTPGRWDAFGGDPFGVRQLVPAPGFLRGGGRPYDYAALRADQVTAFFHALDLGRQGRPTAAELSPQALARQRATATSQKVRDRAGNTVRHEIPHLAHSIWFGGPLYDDGQHGARTDFRHNISAAVQANPGVTFVVWTDMTRAQVDEVRRLRPGRTTTVRQQQVASMLEWASGRPNMVLINVDEVFNADTPALMQAEIQTERARGGKSYGMASDMFRIEVLHAFGGVYSDGDNRLTGLIDHVQTIARRPDGFAVARADMPRNAQDPVDRDSRSLANAGLTSPARGQAISVYRDLLQTNYGMTYAALLRRPYRGLADVDDHRINQDDTRFGEKLHQPSIEVIQRTGPNKITFDAIAAALGLTQQGNAAAGDRFLLGAVPPEVNALGSKNSWNSGFSETPTHVERDRLFAVIRALVIELHAELRNRPGVLYLPAIARSVETLPTADRIHTWNTALALFHASLGQRTGDVVWMTGKGVTVPTEVHPTLVRLFPDAGHIGVTLADTSSAPAEAHRRQDSEAASALRRAAWVEGRPVDFLNPARFREQTADPSVLHPRSRS